MLLTTLAILGTAVTVLFIFLKNKNNYWKKRGLISPKPSLVLGNYSDFILLKKNLGDTVTEICKQFPKEPIIGAYYGTEPVVIVKNPDLLKTVLTKDFYYFSSRELTGFQDKEIITRNVFNQEGDTWKVMRQNLTPLFSSAKIKKMFYLIENRTKDLEKLLAKEIANNQVHEIRSFIGRYTMDCIGSCIFGLETNVMNEGKNNPFLMISEKFLDFRTHKVLKGIFRTIWPNIFYGLRLRAISDDINVFFMNLIGKVFSERSATPNRRHDFIDLLLGFKENSYISGDGLKSMKNKSESKVQVKIAVSDEMLIAQSMVFFAAGFETSAATMSFTLYEISKHPHILNKVLDEVDAYMRKQNGKITYECVTDLPYLEACIDEALRLYPVLGVVTRQVIEDYRLPSGVVLEKGIRVHLPIHYIHKHPDYFPDPEEFRPERFLGDNKLIVKPYTYFPFGEGPRICIGMRFAKMQMLAGLVTLLKNYSVELPPGMPRTVDFEPMAFTTQIKTKVHLRFIPRR